MAVRGILWEKSVKDASGVRCMLCSHYCHIADGASGRCRVRVNRAGVLYSLSSDRIVAANADPVEKKPLFHFLPGTGTFSLGTNGCNMTCVFCQNHTISQAPVPPFKTPLDILSPQLVRDTVSSAVSSGCSSLSFTYNEPSVSIELIRSIAPLAKDIGLETIMVSNGYSSREALTLLAPLISAANLTLNRFRMIFTNSFAGPGLFPSCGLSPRPLPTVGGWKLQRFSFRDIMIRTGSSRALPGLSRKTSARMCRGIFPGSGPCTG